MKIAVSGAGGLIGTYLLPSLRAVGDEPLRLVRRAAVGGDEIEWIAGLDPRRLSGLDAVIHLAGESLVGRWTEAKKQHILRSRVQRTRQLAEALAAARPRPPVLLAASAVGYYGACGDEVLTEESPVGSDFLAEVASEWEHAASPARAAGVRVVHMRLGMVLSSTGGALKLMLPAFRLGLGGRLGSGHQWMSWIALDDAVAAIHFLLRHGTVSGPVNLVAPHPVRNADFTEALAAALHRPAHFALNAGIVKLVFGEMGEALLLSGQRAVPRKLSSAGYNFQYPQIKTALEGTGNSGLKKQILS